eukprot:TRINITY_DN525_c0_g1_i1.p1 TRINITY_DN525_c0_g1~~TRINITY_DN525_c0_g1_i1.p1  ORF type:complete len:482 (+),score=112.04 TRINITY_DN525_c0_g1_i1:89-1534(+)
MPPPAWALKLSKMAKVKAPNIKKKAAPKPPTKKATKAAPAAMKTSAAAPAGAPAAKKQKVSGGRAVDSSVPESGLKVVEDYTVTLNQTNIGGGANNNKFYKIQVLEGKGKFYTWNRWGRVGDEGECKLTPCGTSFLACKEFCQKFRSKTGNDWRDRDNFTPKVGKYKIVETEESRGKKGGGGSDAPMGKLTEAQIAKGRKVLDKLAAVLKKPKPDKTQVDALSGEFYTMIPHNFGWKKPPPIDSKDLLAAKTELLKFYLRMGFDKHDDKADLSPISGVMALPVPKSLGEACTGICGRGDVKSSEDEGKTLAARQAGRPKKKMEPHQYGSIMLYTSNAIYTALNKCLRDRNRASVKKYFKYLRLLLDALGVLPQQRKTLWRGVSVDLFDNPMYKVGNTVTWWGVSSCTSDKGVADGFAGGCGGGCTVVTIQAKTACDISAISFYGNEKESLLAPGTKFKVKSKSRTNGISQITLEEIGRSIE